MKMTTAERGSIVTMLTRNDFTMSEKNRRSVCLL